ncbi:tripartite tricarboxylate transporter permease [Candidatus Formimonas warabiya]|uniref:tripartite tricarboxylate transporter permease n=1 Tax=Formimonas warabiya TaxID=1761012 RepID=UPI0011D056A8|nr:tripartite tricarboxylate transporter permease [Candidatus Formimonas warabiya]
MSGDILEGLKILSSYIWIVPLGVALGMVIGAIPGLTSSNSLAIMLPILFAMPPESGLIFMVSIYGGAEVGNSYPAILLNIPGTPGAAVTTIEGYPLAKQGQASRALGISIMASTLGAVFGAIFSITSAPLLAKVALKFSSVEICIVVLFGIMVIAQMSSGGIWKALFAGFFGLLLATTGTDPIYGQARGTFGSLFLVDELPVVPALVGLLALSELFVIIEHHGENEQQVNTDKNVVGIKGIAEGFRDVLKRPVEWIRASFIGLIIGAIPGAGGSVASFVAYQQSASFAPPKIKELFGKGRPEGLIAAEASNNAVVGGSLIPLLTLGLPGSGSMAVLMVVMGYHGLYLGPRLFSLNGDIAYTVLWSQFVAAFMMIVIGTILAYFAYRVSFIKMSVIVPVVAIFALIGGFAPRQFVFDMGLVVIFGVLGYFMKKYHYPPIAMLLGIILGPLFEANLFRGLKMGLGSPAVFFNRPLAIVLWVLLVLTMVAPPVIRRYSQRQKPI